MKRRLFLHLGLSKTGTTNIQLFLRSNQEFLASRGVIYPEISAGISTHPSLAPSVLRTHAGREVNHVALAMEIMRQSADSPVEEIATPLWSKVFKQIEMSDAHTAIISFENFYRRPELFRFDLLVDQLKKFVVEGVIYLRPQEDWVSSLYSQAIRGSARIKTSFTDFMKIRITEIRYSILLDAIRIHIPLDGLIAEDFIGASDSGLITNFLRKVGITGEGAISFEDNTLKNRSLEHWATLFLLKCNQSGLSDEAFIQLRRAFSRGAASDVISSLRPGLDVATPEERKSLRGKTAADAGRLKERYGITLTQRTRETIAYRPFDREDFRSIRTAVEPRLSAVARSELDRVF